MVLAVARWAAPTIGESQQQLHAVQRNASCLPSLQSGRGPAVRNTIAAPVGAFDAECRAWRGWPQKCMNKILPAVTARRRRTSPRFFLR